MGTKKKTSGVNWWFAGLMLFVPLIFSVVSAFHVIDFMALSNNQVLAVSLGVIFEVGLIAALMGLGFTDKVNQPWLVFFIFVFLTAYQLIGNSYYCYNFITIKLSEHQDWITNLFELFNFWTDDDPTIVAEIMIIKKRVLAFVSGMALPILSISFVHLAYDYIKNNSKKGGNITAPVKEPYIPSPIEEPYILNPIDQISIPEEDVQEFFIKKKEGEDKLKDQVDKMNKESLSFQLLSCLFNAEQKDKTLKIGDKIPSYSVFLDIVQEKEIANADEKLIKNFLNDCYMKIIQARRSQATTGCPD